MKKAAIIIVIILSMVAIRFLLIEEQRANVEIGQFSSYYEEGTDGWCIDQIMYEHPSWSYDKAEDRLFMVDSLCLQKYPEER